MDSEHEGVLERAYTVAINLDTELTQTEFGEGETFSLGPSSGAIVATADTTRMGSRVKAGMQSSCLLMQIRPESFDDDDVAERIDLALKQTKVIDLRLCRETRQLVRELVQPSFNGAVGRLLTESTALTLLARTLLLTGAGAPAPRAKLTAADVAKLSIVQDMIVSQPSRDFSLSNLAKEAGMSLSALKAKFPQAFGVSVFEFIADLRLNRAKDLIQREGWSVSKAAHHAGYQHQSSFTAAFKRRFGITPSSLRGWQERD